MWPKILNQETLNTANYKLIGTHPSALPLGRGRHALHWQRVLGIRCSSVTSFWIDEGIDTGDIIASIPFSIDFTKDIVYDNKILLSKYFLLGFWTGIRLYFQSRKGQKQSDNYYTYWPKRGASNTEIDFRMTAKAIIQHVKSISSPWPMASIKVSDGEAIRIKNARYAPFALFKRKHRWSIFGTILKSKNNNQFLVRCFDGAVWLTIDMEKSDINSIKDWLEQSKKLISS